MRDINDRLLTEVINGNVSGVEELLNLGARPLNCSETNRGKGALHLAADLAHHNRRAPLPIVDLLLRSGADIEDTNSRGESVLAVAVISSSDLVEFLLKKGANPDPNVDAEKIPLVMGVSFSRSEAVKHLVEYGADIERLNSNGLTPLAAAVCYGELTQSEFRNYHAENLCQIVKTLLQAGAKCDGVTLKKLRKDVYTKYTGSFRDLVLECGWMEILELIPN